MEIDNTGVVQVAVQKSQRTGTKAYTVICLCFKRKRYTVPFLC